MLTLRVLAGGLLAALPAAAGAYPRDVVDGLAIEALESLGSYLKANPEGNCTLESADRRQEWSDLSIPQRKDYIRSVVCLQNAPTKFNSTICPGCRTRMDDFTAVHMQQTPFIHVTASFLAWHRYFVWAYETALRDECGYQGYHPYWNWDRYADDLLGSPLFNGNDSSLGGNGAYSAYRGIPVPGSSPQQFLSQGPGGGCVTSGPFKDMQVNLGPSKSAVLNTLPPNPRPDGLGFNPRCLRRDILALAASYTTANYTYELITKSATIEEFQGTMQGQTAASARLGIHVAGHYSVGGDPGGDLYVGPSEPSFFLHHAMIDRVWWAWQLRADVDVRLTTAIAGTLTTKNNPPSRNATLADDLDFGGGVLGPPAKLGELLKTTGGLGGRFCYVYDQ